MAWVIGQHIVIAAGGRAVSKLEALLPVQNKTEYNGGAYLSFPHTLEIYNVLRRLGVNVDGAEVFRHQYEYPLLDGIYEPYPQQVDLACFFTQNRRAFCGSEPRTGKTAAGIAAADFLMKQGLVKKTLVVAPLIVAQATWPKEIPSLLQEAPILLHGTKKEREYLLKQEARFYLINPDGLKIIEDSLAEKVSSGEIGCIILDESSQYANPKSALWKSADRLINKCGVEYAWMFNGTPGDPVAVYGQAKLIHPKNVARISPVSWKAKTMKATMGFGNGRQFTTYSAWPQGTASGLEAAKACAEILSPSMRFEQRDVFKATNKNTSTMVVPMSPAQQKMYNALMDSAVLMLAEGVHEPSNVADKISKLLQVSSGAVIVDGEAHRIDMSPKLDALVDVINGTDRKVVIFASYTGVIDYIVEYLNSRGIVTGRMDGTVTGVQRQQLLSKFQDGLDMKVLVAHPKTAGWGIDLSAADTLVYFGAPRCGEVQYQQSIERLSSSRQKAEEIRVIHLASSQADQKAFGALTDKVKSAQGLTDLLRSIVE